MATIDHTGLDQLEELREAIAHFLDRPATDRWRAMLRTARRAAAGPAAPLRSRLDRMQALVPGSREVMAEAHRLRHDVLRLIDLRTGRLAG